MREKHWLYCGAGALAAAVGPVINPARTVDAEIVILLLVTACLLGLKLLFCLLELPRGAVLGALAGLAACGLAQGEGSLPLIAVLLAEAADLLTTGGRGASMALVATALWGLVAEEALVGILCTAMFLPPLLAAVWALDSLEAFRLRQEDTRGELDRLRRENLSHKKSAQTVEHAARLEERNRLAARIHDKIGHGVSGSILLVEAAMAVMDTDGERARETLDTAANNLRLCVDDIRAALRDERSTGGRMGLADLAAALSRFELEHPRIRTGLEIEGEMDTVSPVIWRCAHDSLTEALTNVLKHSAADRFFVAVSRKNGLVRIRFADNGNCGTAEPGLGLLAMEERCAAARGRCFFQGGEEGFAIVMTFTDAAVTTERGEALD